MKTLGDPVPLRRHDPALNVLDARRRFAAGSQRSASRQRVFNAFICGVCKHEKGVHFTKTGNPRLSGKKCDSPGCTCTGWVLLKSYEAQRTAQGKPEVNPLAGATTLKNTVIRMNKIPKATFEAVATHEALLLRRPHARVTANAF